MENMLSEPFAVTTGVLQGDVLVSFLFIIVMDYIARHAEGNTGYLTHIGPPAMDNPRPQRVQLIAKEAILEMKLNDLAFADDIALRKNTNSKGQLDRQGV